MTKTLAKWLHARACDWKIPGRAVLHNGLWHKYEGETPGWAECGTWIAPAFVQAWCGKGEKHDNPWDSGGYKRDWLCRRCFVEEIVIMENLRSMWVDLVSDKEHS
jgi:hypothetical protein